MSLAEGLGSKRNTQDRIVRRSSLTASVGPFWLSPSVRFGCIRLSVLAESVGPFGCLRRSVLASFVGPFWLPPSVRFNLSSSVCFGCVRRSVSAASVGPLRLRPSVSFDLVRRSSVAGAGVCDGIDLL